MRIDCTIDSAQLLLRMRNGQRRLAYAAVNAINATAKRIQESERLAVTHEFTVRRPEFMRREAAIIKPFASVGKARPFAEISVGQKPRLLLSTFEKGGERKPFTPGARRVAIPVKGSPARPTFKSQVPPELQFKALRFRKTRAMASLGTTKSGRARRTRAKQSGILYGEQGTYLVPSVGVFQRKRQTGVRRLLYSFKPRVRLAARLGFVDTARREGDRWFREEMEREVIKALAHDRGRSL